MGRMAEQLFEHAPCTVMVVNTKHPMPVQWSGPEGERAGPTNDFVRALPKRAVKVLERHVGRGRDIDTEAWIDGMIACAKRGGLFACDDFAAATWMIARVMGENLGATERHEATVALGAVLGGSDLVRFYLSDDYHRLRDTLSTVAPGV